MNSGELSKHIPPPLSSNANPTTSTATMNEMRTRVNEFASKSDDPGRFYITKVLSEEVGEDPWKTITDLQSRLSLGYSECDPLLELLTLLGTSYSDAMIHVFQTLKDELDSKLQLVDDTGLLILLKETIRFLGFKELKSIPISILKRIHRIPPQYLKILVEKNLINEFPVPIRRQAWENSGEYFIKSISDICNSFISNENQRQESFKQLCERIGPSENLFRIFASFCVTSYIKDKNANWGRLLTNFVVHLNETSQQIRTLTKLHELGSMIDRCRRMNKIDPVAIRAIRETIKYMIVAQAVYEEKLHKKALETFYEAHPDAVGANEPSRTVTSEKKNFLAGWKFLAEKDTLGLFALPVTEAIAPGYFSIIKVPMDLSTIKKKIEKDRYNSLEDFHKDVELMLNNCKTFNGSTSEFGIYAEKLLRVWKEKFLGLKGPATKSADSTPAELKSVESKSAAVVSSKLEKASEPDRSTAAARSDGRLKQSLLEALDLVCSADTQKIFFEKVTDRIAPDYSKIIKTPMYFNLIKSKLKSDQYQSLEKFNHDMLLIFQNCVTYNGEGTYYAQYALGVRKTWETKHLELQKLYTPKEVIPAISAKPVEKEKAKPRAAVVDKPEQGLTASSTVSHSAGLSTAEILAPLLLEEWLWVTSMDSLEVFAAEVDLVGYRDIIHHPMDLGTIREKIMNGEYVSCEDFQKDINLMFENCIVFNGKDDPVGQYARLLRKEWQGGKEFFTRKVLPGGGGDPAKLTALELSKVSSWDCRQMRQLKIWERDEKKSVENLIAMESPDPKKGANIGTLANVLRMAVEFLHSVDQDHFFVELVTDAIAPGYSKVVAQPMAISLLRNKISKNFYKNLESLNADVQLIHKNCMRYNGSQSPFSKASTSLIAKWGLFYLLLRHKFPFLASNPNALVLKSSVEKRKFEAEREDETSMKKAKHAHEPSTSAGKPTASPMAAEYKEKVDSMLQFSMEGKYFPGQSLIKLPSILTFEELSEIWNSRNLLLLLSHALKYLAGLDTSKSFSRPMQQQIQNSKVITYLMDFNTMKVKLEQRKSYGSLESFHSDVIIMIRNCFLQFCHEEKFPLKKTPQIVIDTAEACKTAQKIHFAWNLVFQNLQAVLANNRSAAVKALNPSHLESSEEEKELAKFWDGKKLPEDVALADAESKEKETEVKMEMDEEPQNEHKQESSKGGEAQKTADNPDSAANTDMKPSFSAPPSVAVQSSTNETEPSTQVASTTGGESTKGKTDELAPLESELLKSSLAARKALGNTPASSSSGSGDGVVTSQLTELPPVLTTTAFSWTTLMLVDPQLQAYLTRFLAWHCLRLVREKIASSSEEILMLSRDPFLRFLCQFLQIGCTTDLHLHSTDDHFIRIYLPAVLLEAISPSIRSDKSFVEQLLNGNPLPAHSSLDSQLLKATLERLVTAMKSMKAKSAESK